MRARMAGMQEVLAALAASLVVAGRALRPARPRRSGATSTVGPAAERRCSRRSTPCASAHGLVRLRVSASAERRRRAPLGPDGPARLLQPRLGERHVVLEADRARSTRCAATAAGWSARTSSGPRPTSARLARVQALAREPAAPREPAQRRAGARSASRAVHSTSAPGVYGGGPATIVTADFGAAADSPRTWRYPFALRACSSVEERRPSKPWVGGSNPPRRIVRLFLPDGLSARSRACRLRRRALETAGREDSPHARLPALE